MGERAGSRAVCAEEVSAADLQLNDSTHATTVVPWPRSPLSLTRGPWLSFALLCTTSLYFAVRGPLTASLLFNRDKATYLCRQ